MKKIFLLSLSIFSAIIACAQCPFTVAYVPKPVSQGNQDYNCWAAATTMMYEWKNKKDQTMDATIKSLGEPFYGLFLNNKGLLASQKVALQQKAGLKAEAPASYSLTAWCNLLKSHGVLWVTTDENPKGKDFYIHARILYGIQATTDANNPNMLFIDPADGRKVTEKFLDFIPKYEAELKKIFKQLYKEDWPTNFPIRIQILHW